MNYKILLIFLLSIFIISCEAKLKELNKKNLKLKKNIKILVLL